MVGIDPQVNPQLNQLIVGKALCMFRKMENVIINVYDTDEFVQLM